MRIAIQKASGKMLIFHDEYDNLKISNLFSSLLSYIEMYIIVNDDERENPDIYSEIKRDIANDFKFVDTDIWPSNNFIITESDFENDDNKCWKFLYDTELFGEREYSSDKDFDEEIKKIIEFCESNANGLVFTSDIYKTNTRIGPGKSDFVRDREFLLNIQDTFKNRMAKRLQNKRTKDVEMKKADKMTAVLKEELCKENAFDQEIKCVTDLITNECLTDEVFVNSNRKPNPYRYCYNGNTVEYLDKDPFTREEMNLKRIDADDLTKMKQVRIARAMIAHMKLSPPNLFKDKEKTKSNTIK